MCVTERESESESESESEPQSNRREGEGGREGDRGREHLRGPDFLVVVVKINVRVGAQPLLTKPAARAPQVSGTENVQRALPHRVATWLAEVSPGDLMRGKDSSVCGKN